MITSVLQIMKYCKKCLQPNTRPGIVFNDEQVCMACVFEENKNKIDWDNRLAELKKIASETVRLESAPANTVVDLNSGTKHRLCRRHTEGFQRNDSQSLSVWSRFPSAE